MADALSRSLLPPQGGNSKTRGPPTGKRSTQKTPLLVFLFLALLIGCILLTVITLITSDQDTVPSWRIRPSIILAFISGLYSIILGGLFGVGVAVTWWRSIQHGTTLKRLHYIQAAASPKDFWGGFAAGSSARKVASAAFIVFVVKLAVGPISQRATRTRTQSVARNIDMNIHIAKQISDGYYGTWGGFNRVDIVQGMFLNLTMRTEPRKDYDCPSKGTCETRIPAAGLNYGCTSVSETLNLLDDKSVNSTLFSIDMNMSEEFGQPMLFLTMKYLSSVDGSCLGTLTTDSCSIIPATIWYPITIQNSTLTLNHNDLLSERAVVSNYTTEADKHTNNLTAPTGPLQGLYLGLGTILKAEAFLNKSDGMSAYTPSLKPLRSAQWPDLFFDTTINANDSTSPAYVRENCPLRWFSPRDSIIQSFFEFSFRSAYDLGGNADEHYQNFTAIFRSSELWFSTDYGWLAATVVTMVLGNAAAMSLLWGWWDLDRYVSLSSLETGRAFGAPILLSAGPEKESKAIIDEIGNERVAHDGDELVWNGTVYASGRWEGGTVPTVRGRMGGRTSGDTEGSFRNSLRELEGESPNRHSFGNVRGHWRGMSSVSHGGSGSSSASFEHSLGVSTRKWFGGPEGGGTVKHTRQRSGSGSGPGTPMLPLSLTPASGIGAEPSSRGSAVGNESSQLPPIKSSGGLQIPPLNVGVGTRRGSAGEGSGTGSGASSGKRPLSLIVERNSQSPQD
ncbi:uncharacterized protein BDR25DRAFT_342830 [Lindgomyces ingoldianus]|uniref:Uncharacterized protein n=1 Tax=Lindgomyces ingoldianus TaxID=673940 RepID=A0ACB6QVK1_9PLEO|nr:uncharacterized protein BDR25DRAFT_342830 [Lindgomyces ingoldianus]KAF2471064.1 hypothetical protein BDR25DRAFT_342830 [Lindgomyces ingoldianus]